MMPNGNEIRVVEREDGAFYVDVILDSKPLSHQHGPFADHDEAEGVAVHLAGVCRVMGQALPAPRQCA